MDSTEALIALILELCKEQQITINKLATSAGLTQSTVDSIIRGKSGSPRFRTAEKIAHGFNMPPEEFFRRIIEKMDSDSPERR